MKERKWNLRVRRSGFCFEQLEGRRMLSANPWHNPQMAADVNGDGSVVAADALQVINELNSGGARPLVIAEGETTVPAPAFLDVNNDNNLSPFDALQVISEINGEGPLASDGDVNLLGDDDIVDPACLDVLVTGDVDALLRRAAAASATTNDVIAVVVDRGGTILGVRAEGASLFPTDLATRVFAIDGAVAKARTAAFFAHNMAPLTSRTIRNISQSTITQGEVESNPNSSDDDLRGPGSMAPIGLGAHFPPGIMHTPPVDLFDIEHTNRDSLLHPGLDGRRGTADDILLDYRFNIDRIEYVPIGQEIEAPESYGRQSGLMPLAQSRGIATLPGGIPLYKNFCHVGGIGVFFPGTDGFASHEQGFTSEFPSAGAGPLGASGSTADALKAEVARTNADKVLEAEWIAFAAAGGSPAAGVPVGDLGGIGLPAGITGLPFGRLDLVGIRLEVFGPNPTTLDPVPGVEVLKRYDNPAPVPNGVDQPVDPVATFLSGATVPAGWLVT
ncbi:MAG: dockerin type I domain-containing protein, partial [Pirellulaceae bacterium]